MAKGKSTGGGSPAPALPPALDDGTTEAATLPDELARVAARSTANSTSAQAVASRKPPATSLGRCHPSETIENDTPSAMPAPTSAERERSRGGITTTSAIARAIAAVA